MAQWPDLTDYHEALQHPKGTLADPELQKAAIEQDRFGMPKPATGANAVVYKATSKKDVWAVRCFLRPISDHAERYAAISRHLEKVKHAFATRFVYLGEGIRVKGNGFPIVKMQWVQGPPLDRHVEGLLAKPKELAALRERWRALLRDLAAAKIAHGDLQHGNVLVRGKELLLIDYDGMWVPGLAGRRATEIGHRAYQHPRRGEEHYGPWLDHFSALVVYLSLAALEADPSLWERYNNGDNLLFVREDFLEPGRAPIWGELAALDEPRVKHLAGVLAACAGKEPKDVPALESILARPRKVKPLELTPSAPIPAPKPRWTSAPPKGSALEVAARWQAAWSRPGERVETRWKREMKDVLVEVEKPGEVLAPDRVRALLVAGAGIAAGVGLGLVVAPALGLVAAGGGLAATAAFPPRRRAIRVKAKVMRRQEQQVKEEVKVAVPGHRSAVMALQCTADGRRVLAVAKLGELGIWEVPEDRFAASGVRLPPFDQAGVAQGAARVALATERAALVFDLAQGKKTEHPVDPAKRLRAVALSADGSRMALGYEQHGVEVVEVASRRSLGTLSAQGGRVTALAFSEDGQALVLGTAAGAVQIARLGRTEKPIEERAHRSAVTALAVAGKGQAYATADESGLIAVWGKDGKRRASATLAGRGVRVLCFAGDGPYALAAGCGDGTVHIVNPETGAVVAKHAVGGAAMTALAYARGKMALAAGTASGQVTLLAADA